MCMCLFSRLSIHYVFGVQKRLKNSTFNFVRFSFNILSNYLNTFLYNFIVNDGDYLNSVSEQSLAENVTRVLYPNDNVKSCFYIKL